MASFLLSLLFRRCRCRCRCRCCCCCCCCCRCRCCCCSCCRVLFLVLLPLHLLLLLPFCLKWLRNLSKMAPKWGQHGCQRAPGGLVGGFLVPLKRLGRLRVGFQGLMGRLLEASWRPLDGQRGWFQPFWGPKGSRNGGHEGPNWSRKGDSSRKRDFFKNLCFFYRFQ